MFVYLIVAKILKCFQILKIEEKQFCKSRALRLLSQLLRNLRRKFYLNWTEQSMKKPLRDKYKHKYTLIL